MSLENDTRRFPKKRAKSVNDRIDAMFKKYNLPYKWLIDEFTAEQITDQLQTIFGKTKYDVLWSGGKDSTAAAYSLAEMGKLRRVITVDTGIAINEPVVGPDGREQPALFDFLHDEAQRHGWEWKLLSPLYSYTDWCLANGFPGPNIHDVIMGKLKYQVYRKYLVEQNDPNVCLISGIRKNESDRRFGNFKFHLDIDGKMLMARPIFYWSDTKVYQYCLENDLRISPVHAILHISGDCGCGAFAQPYEPMLMRQFFPGFFKKIKEIERLIQEKGTEKAKRYGTWGHGQSMADVQLQTMLEEYPLLGDACGECAIYTN